MGGKQKTTLFIVKSGEEEKGKTRKIQKTEKK